MPIGHRDRYTRKTIRHQRIRFGLIAKLVRVNHPLCQDLTPERIHPKVGGTELRIKIKSPA